MSQAPENDHPDGAQPILSRMRFENPSKFLEFYQKQLSRGIVGLRHPHPIAPGSSFTVIISPPGAPNQLRLNGIARRVSLRADGAYRLRVAVERTPLDDAWLDGYIAGQRSVVARAPDADDGSISGSVISEGAQSWSPATPAAAPPPRRPALPTTVEVHDLARRIDRVDYYVLLGVARDVGPSELQSRFHLLTRRFHPDLFHGRDAAMVKAVGAIYRRMNEAYAVLRSPARRERYDAGLTGPAEERAMRLSGDAQDAARRHEATPGATTPVGEYYWTQARLLLKNYQGDQAQEQAVAEAIRIMHTALLFEPRNQHFHTALAHLKSRRTF